MAAMPSSDGAIPESMAGSSGRDDDNVCGSMEFTKSAKAQKGGGYRKTSFTEEACQKGKERPGSFLSNASSCGGEMSDPGTSAGSNNEADALLGHIFSLDEKEDADGLSDMALFDG